MSHVLAGGEVYTDLDLLREIVRRFCKLTWMEDQENHAWYGRWVNDYDKEDAAYKRGIDTNDYGKCEHAINVEGSRYEIGVVKRKDGKGYSLVWDSYGTDGRAISQYIGNEAEKISIAYHQEYISKFANENWFMQSQEEDSEDFIITLEK